MCGVAGICRVDREPVDAALLQRMTDVVAYRGPDGEGQYLDGPVGLGHRRLAILDLSDAGRQPMATPSGRSVISYSGEVYNFRELRQELEAEGVVFRSRTDTEVVLHAYEAWGEACLERFNGMFAFAVWDRARRRLLLARDRYGIKPLYWTFRGSALVFASEIKAILQHPAVSPSVCYPALNEYFTFQNVFTDLTLFDGIRLLPPGCFLTLDLGREAPEPVIRKYWEYPVEPEPLRCSEEECAEQLHRLLVQAVTRQLVSDVPVGAYLSGGVDSGSIASVAVGQMPRLRTFTGGFDLTSASGLELGCDERQAAEILSNLFKTEHYEVVLHAGDMETVLPELIWHLEDLRVGQCYPNYYVARLAGKFVKVVLTGAGGDELFGGYPWRYYRGSTGAINGQFFQQYYQFWQRLVPDEDKPQLFRDRTSRALQGHSTFEAFRAVFNGWPSTMDRPEDAIQASLYFEFKTFLHGLLVVEDKLSMAHGLETRVPFLDNDLVDFALRVPVRYKLRQLDHAPSVDEDEPAKASRYRQQPTSDGKVVLRRAMGRLVPEDITRRAKQGFSAPDASWFRGESIDYLNRLLRTPAARIYEYLNPIYVAQVLDDHCSGRINRRLLIWSLLSFEWWLRTFITR